ncbi:MAG: peptide deformylase [Deltaproteobacteria bacterium]|nr:peptide deformylase [Deltaproteobacteria bacterium]MDH3383840.1 peptide deformylase [Deltaproteobacteria bacterium]
MLRPILTYPDPFLSTRSLPVKIVDDTIRDLVRDMFETMYAANGVGLAAPQVGVGKRVIVVDISPVDEEAKPFALVNPEIVGKTGWTEGAEGCLSVPGVEGMVCRFESIVLRGMNEQGEPVTVEASGILARALQHEIDHLDGILFVEKLAAPTASAK